MANDCYMECEGNPELIKSHIFRDMLPIYDDFVRWEDFNGVRTRKEWQNMVHRMRVACKGSVVCVSVYFDDQADKKQVKEVDALTK